MFNNEKPIVKTFHRVVIKRKNIRFYAFESRLKGAIFSGAVGMFPYLRLSMRVD